METSAKRRPVHDDFWYERKMDESLNRWFAHYEQAEASLKAYGGFLLPFRSQFVICESAAIRTLGLDPDDPDWTLVGRNIARPADQDAFERLRSKRENAREQKHVR